MGGFFVNAGSHYGWDELNRGVHKALASVAAGKRSTKAFVEAVRKSADQVFSLSDAVGSNDETHQAHERKT
jgi:hypothetical protein